MHLARFLKGFLHNEFCSPATGDFHADNVQGFYLVKFEYFCQLVYIAVDVLIKLGAEGNNHLALQKASVIVCIGIRNAVCRNQKLGIIEISR